MRHISAVALVVLAAGVVSAGASPTGSGVRLVGKPSGVDAGRPWAATLLVTGRGRPVLLARLDRRALQFQTAPAGRGRFRVRITLPTPGRWALSARLRGRTYPLGAITVRSVTYRLVEPAQILLDATGQLLIAERGPLDRVAEVDPTSGAVRTFARGFVDPFGLAVGPNGRLFVTSGAEIRRMRPDTAIVASFGLERLGPLAVTGDGTIYFATTTRIGRVDPGGAVRWLNVSVNAPHGLAVEPGGTLLVADTGNRRILRVDLPSATSTVVAGNVPLPMGIGVRPSGVIVVGAYESGTILEIDRDEKQSVFARGLDRPYALTLAPEDAAYVVEAGGTVRRVSRDGVVTTLRLVERT
jgi:DNA-binding beta-propeller fold protein YncE